MQISWSFVLNVLMLVGVVVAITRVIRSRKENPILDAIVQKPFLSETEIKVPDDIIAIRKVAAEEVLNRPQAAAVAPKIVPRPVIKEEPPTSELPAHPSQKPLVLFLLAPENRELEGYELLQTILACGLRFGEGQLFHRHQFSNGQGEVLCSLATATATGTFDLQNIGDFSARGLCLYMNVTQNLEANQRCFEAFMDTAKCLGESLNARLLDDKKNVFDEVAYVQYKSRLQVGQAI
ncbi:MAG: cell division protein ZipA C-terminal FtsZ-binding domain-containing protein [Legionellaceae bacterium]|nr:cell division protein ZipA C-terminal FtsZ-binding domain-containing protein [Legionellaceae bacterium]